MPSLATVKASNTTTLASFPRSFTPTALFLGGTSGIGQAMAQSFAHHTNGNSRIIIIGRNRHAAESTIASFPPPSREELRGTEEVRHEFVECDATLMENVHKTTKELLGRLNKLNYLVLSPGFLSIKGRDETSEGIDKKLALYYYARWTFIHDLLPLLLKTKQSGEDVSVITILAADTGGEINWEDLGLKHGYGFVSSNKAAITYTDYMLESFSTRNPNIPFTHTYPGPVRTPLTSHITGLPKPLSVIINALLYPVQITPQDCAEWMLYAMWEGGKGGGGAWRRGARGEELGRPRFVEEGGGEKGERLWEHTMRETRSGVEGEL
ncbi:hypothetical protein JAAARDRAFT_38436 [Jaapia argillacea MUCL 33604]|uniref:NAD(P)-binding protein n=1 Tax=Jaapia argillacea MUCL 33604 TaxID=933084 RepID=A0A067PSJ9_9AGAM|nr:hypothetical protein JAAARDRAFT_38436 [Jaapia argillacea MUCL 33604]